MMSRYWLTLLLVWIGSCAVLAKPVCFSDTMQELCINHVLHGHCSQFADKDVQKRCLLMDKITKKCQHMGCV